MTRVEVSFVPVEVGTADAPDVLAQLGDDDVEAIRRSSMPIERDRAATACVAARRVIAARLGLHPLRVRLVKARQGDGHLVEGSSLTVNWSHSGRWTMLAVADEGPVGACIEEVCGEATVRALAVFGIASLEEFVARLAIVRMNGDSLMQASDAAIALRAIEAPAGYVAAIAVPRELRTALLVETRTPSSPALATQWGFPGAPTWGCVVHGFSDPRTGLAPALRPSA